MSYDSWLEGPYQAREDLECPECGAQMEEDKREKSVDCECGYGYGVDWDAVAEARMEAYDP